MFAPCIENRRCSELFSRCRNETEVARIRIAKRVCFLSEPVFGKSTVVRLKVSRPSADLTFVPLSSTEGVL